MENWVSSIVARGWDRDREGERESEAIVIVIVMKYSSLASSSSSPPSSFEASHTQLACQTSDSEQESRSKLGTRTRITLVLSRASVVRLERVFSCRSIDIFVRLFFFRYRLIRSGQTIFSIMCCFFSCRLLCELFFRAVFSSIDVY